MAGAAPATTRGKAVALCRNPSLGSPHDLALAHRLAMVSSSRKKRSAWRRVIDTCPDRAAHLSAVVERRIAASGVCRVLDDDDNWELGLEAVTACLRHTFTMSDEDVDELVGDIEWELRPYDSPRDHKAKARPLYAGGHPRIAVGDHEGEFPSVDDLEELIWSRGSELMEAPVRSIAEIAYVGEDGETEWSRPLDYRALGGSGYLTVSYVDENDMYSEYVIGVWSPLKSRDAKVDAIVKAYDAWYDDNPWAISKTIHAVSPTLWAEVVKRRMRGQNSTAD